MFAGFLRGKLKFSRGFCGNLFKLFLSVDFCAHFLSNAKAAHCKEYTRVGADKVC
jgi:hypothetical protein